MVIDCEKVYHKELIPDHLYWGRSELANDESIRHIGILFKFYDLYIYKDCYLYKQTVWQIKFYKLGQNLKTYRIIYKDRI